MKKKEKRKKREITPEHSYYKVDALIDMWFCFKVLDIYVKSLKILKQDIHLLKTKSIHNVSAYYANVIFIIN